MKKLLLLALASLSLSVAGCKTETNKLEEIKEAGKITMATSPDFAPMEFIDLSKSGQDAYIGADIQLAKHIAEKLGVELEIQAMDFNAVQAAVSQGKVDMGVSAFAYTEERAEALLLSDFYGTANVSGQGLLVRKDEAENYKTAEDFAGKLIGVQNGTSLQLGLVESQIEDPQIELVSNLNEAVLMLIGEKVDAVAVAGENGAMFADNYDEVAMSEFMFAQDNITGNVIGVAKGQDELMEAINEILAEVNETGIFEEWRAEAIEQAKALGVSAE